MDSPTPTPSSASDPARQLLRHTVATLAYRGGKAIRGAPAEFSTFSCGGGCRSAGAILTHLSDLLDWALLLANGKREWHDSEPLAWNEDVQRFHAALEAFDARLISDQPLQASVERLLQGPIVDALTHVGQLAMMRRLSGSVMRSESYFAADIAAGRVGPDQVSPKREF